MKIYPGKSEFIALANDFNLIPVVTKIQTDTETPVSVFRKICGEEENSILLESYLGGERFDRYSFICCQPKVIFFIKGHDITIKKDSEERRVHVENPFDFLKGCLADFKQAQVKGLPAFTGGLVGYVGYEMARFCDDLNLSAKPDSGFYDAILMLAMKVVVFDNQQQTISVINNVETSGDLEGDYQRALIENNLTLKKLEVESKSHEMLSMQVPADITLPSANFSKAEFMQVVERAKEYIVNGDIARVVISQKFSAHVEGDTFDLYRTLRAINPSRYMFYLNLGETKLVGSSPEINIKLEGRDITLRPIAGTTARTGNDEEDEQLAEKMRNDQKEVAEHVMLVDLGRNDVGRVAEIGSVKVTEMMVVEKFSHVQHLVSNVEGKLRKDLDCFDLFRATFPQGTLSGCSKKRAMEIIHELELVERGPYGGSVGYLGFNGSMDTCITIRTICIQGDQAFMQVGAGIVADSDPEYEYSETVRKVMAVVRAMNIFLNSQRRQK